jgi:hypothetical protein
MLFNFNGNCEYFTDRACIDETFVLDGVPKERIVLAHEPNGKGH